MNHICNLAVAGIALTALSVPVSAQPSNVAHWKEVLSVLSVPKAGQFPKLKSQKAPHLRTDKTDKTYPNSPNP